MDIDLLVMTAAAKLGVHASGAVTGGPLLEVAGSAGSAIEFPDEAQAARFAEACMSDGVPARAYGAAVIVLHG